MKSRIIAFAAYLAFILATVSTQSSSDYRLPKDITPIQYDISLNIDPAADGFNGTVIITFTDNNATENITHFHINADPKYVTISSIIVNGNINCTVMEDENTTLVHIECPQGFSGQQNNATVVFASNYTGQAYGMYKASYLENGTTSWFVATQFEPERARMAIPCLDEPEFKAVFNLDVTVPSGYKVLSNTEIDDFQDDTGFVTYYFESTPKMSTYLLAIFVSKFEPVSGSSDKFKVFARPEMLQYTSTAVHYGQQILSTLGQWLGIPYESLGISKSYQIAEPHKGGAMENWGLVTYGESSLLDSGVNTSSVAQIQSIFTTMSHELAHQWFGDFVTASWWSEIWLNEGFATYFQYFLAEEIVPQFELSKTFVVQALHSALVADSDPSSLPVVSKEDDIYTPANASRKFDTISYQKGAAILNFIANFVGEANLTSGLVNYLKAGNHSNSNTDSFLSTIATAANVTDLPTYLHNWLYEPGYPVVNVSLTSNGTKLTFTQQRFFTPGLTGNSSTEWFVPLTTTFAKDSNFSINATKTWLEPNKSLSIDYSADNGWVVVNLQQLGFYRVNYDEALWKKLVEALKQNVSQIHVTNRAQILDDVFTLAKGDFVDISLALELASFLKNDSAFHSWYVGVKHLTSLLGIGDEEDDDNLQMLIHSLLVNHVQIPDDSTNATTNPVDILGQALFLQTACNVGHSECVTYAQEQFEKFKNGSSLDPNFKSTIICTALKNSKSPREDFDFVFNLLNRTNIEYDKNILGSSLACIVNETLIQEFLVDIINDSTTLDSNEAQKIFTSIISNNPSGPNVILEFVINKTSDIVKHFNGTSQLGTIITGLASKLNTDDQIKKLQQLSNSTSIQDIGETIQKATAQATANKNWSASHRSALKAALKANNGKNSAFATANFMFLTVLAYIAVKLF